MCRRVATSGLILVRWTAPAPAGSPRRVAASVTAVDGKLERRRRAVVHRSTLVAVGGSLGGALGHLVGGGALPASCLPVFAVLAVGTAAAAGAARVARCGRGPWGAWGVLLAGQVAMEVALRSSAVEVPPASPVPPATALVHVSTAAVLTALLLGGERVAADLRDFLDRWVPRSPAGGQTVELVTAPRFHATTSSPLGGAEHLPRDPRGPPHG